MRRTLLRVAEGFFQRPVAMLAPLVFMLAAGAYTASSVAPEFRSSATFDVSSSLSGSPLGGARESLTETVASAVAGNLSQLLRTDAFVATVVERAGAEDLIEGGFLTYFAIRGWLDVHDAGTGVVRVDATSPFADLSQRFAAAAATSFLDYVVASDTLDLSVRITALQDRVDLARTMNAEANADLTEYVESHPAEDETLRPASEVDEILRLTEATGATGDSLVAEQSALAAARAELANAEGGVRRQLALVDPNATLAESTIGLGTTVATMSVFAVLGMTISVAFCLLSVRFDATLRVPDDIERRFGMVVLANVSGSGR